MSVQFFTLTTVAGISFSAQYRTGAGFSSAIGDGRARDTFERVVRSTWIDVPAGCLLPESVNMVNGDNIARRTVAR